jgi:hypothetical protein
MVGIDVFNGHVLHFDFDKGAMEVDPPQLPPGLKWHKFFLSRYGQVFLNMGFGRHRTMVLWDTGATGTTVDETLVKELPGEFTAAGSWLPRFVIDATLKVKTAKLYKAQRLKFGGLTLYNLEMGATDYSALQKRWGAGFRATLGLDIIRRAHWVLDLKHKRWAAY